MARDYLSYWKPSTVEAQTAAGGLQDHAASNQYGRVEKGDTVWLVTVRDGALRLVTRLVVGQVTGQAGAAAALGRDDLWEAEYHIIAVEGTAVGILDIDISQDAGALRFEGAGGNNRLTVGAGGSVNAQQLQTMRLLTPASAALLAGWIGSGDAGQAAAPADTPEETSPPMETFYLGHTFGRNDVLRAMEKFDKKVRATFPEGRWRKFAVVYNGRRYPPKELMRIVIGDRGVGTGGYAINSRYGNLKFKVINFAAPEQQLDAEEAQAEEGYEQKPGDRREWVQRTIKARRGQQAFRNKLRRRYGDRCMITGCAILDIVEAAHISPHQSADDHHEENGLLLRADIHTLFDLDLLGIEPKTLKIRLHPEIEPEYAKVVGDRLRCPAGRRPAASSLTDRFAKFEERCELPL